MSLKRDTPRVLVVEDNGELRRAIVRVLRRLRIDVLALECACGRTEHRYFEIEQTLSVATPAQLGVAAERSSQAASTT